MATRITSTFVMGATCFALGCGIIVSNEIRGHTWDHWVLGGAIALMIIGAHLVSRQAVVSLAKDLGGFLPWGGKRGGE